MDKQPASSNSDLAQCVAKRIQSTPRVGSRITDATLARMIEEGIDVIQLKSYPSTSLPPHIIEATERAIRETVNPPSRGLPEFCEAVAERLSSDLSIRVDPRSEVLTTNGGMHALYVVFSTLLDNGDEVLVPSPCFFLEGMIEPLGGRIVYVPMREEDEYQWDFTLLESKISRRTKVVLLNTPVNPTGYVLTAQDLEQMARIADKHDLLVVADESYDKLVYDRLKHLSIASIPGMQQRTILIRSFTKSYAMTNWRVGYMVAAAELIEQFTKVLEWMVLYGNYASQKAATAALVGPQDWLASLTAEFQANRDFVYGGLKEIKGVSCVKPRGGPFFFLNISRLRGTGEEISNILLREFRIPTVPGSYLHSDNHIRAAFGGARTVLEDFLTQLRLAVEQIGVRKATG